MPEIFNCTRRPNCAAQIVSIFVTLDLNRRSHKLLHCVSQEAPSD